MGLNIENLFVRSDSAIEVALAVESHLTLPLAARQTPAEWPLEVSFREPERGRKISVSESAGGWVAVVEDREVVEPALAISLSETLNTSVVAIQLYEVTGSVGVALIDHGRLSTDAGTRHDIADPLSYANASLAAHKIGISLVQFRETVGRSAGTWRTLSRRR
jgi:hypothetical protein